MHSGSHAYYGEGTLYYITFVMDESFGLLITAKIQLINFRRIESDIPNIIECKG